ncbi:MAG TPA: DUF2207 domain-containing protein [bacterium]|nr:DUF2207 domain-containing protein [bacterium]
MSRSKLLFLSSFVLCLCSSAFAQPYEQETILNYHSDITVNPDASMDVTETIRVVALGDKIDHGIYRDFPFEYRTPWGFRQSVDFEILSIQRDGRPEPYHTEGQSNGLRIYIGSKDVSIPSGVYTYAIRYHTDRQLGFFPDHDELYWNVTGNGWVFPIKEASATVHLPSGISKSDVTAEGYTGPQGSKDRNLTVSVDMGGIAAFRTTAELGAYEGLTVVVGWPKGKVKEPAKALFWAYFIKDNWMLVVALFGLAAILAYYLIVWFLVGRDPSAGTIIPLYEAPDGLSPAAVRFIWKMGYDDKCLAAALIHMATLKRIKIVDNAGTYTLERLSPSGGGKLASEENNLLQRLLGADGTLEIKRTHRTTIAPALQGLKEDLKKSFEKNYFLTNRWFFVGGLIVTVLALLASVFSGDTAAKATGGFMSIWLTGWSVGVVLLVRQAAACWKMAFAARGFFTKSASFIAAVFQTAFALPFVAGEVVGLFMFAKGTSVWMLLFLLIFIFVNFLFFHLLKAPTLGGRKILDKIEGLRMYLGVAEKDRLNAMAPPRKTPEIFEKFLAYALALDVDQEWSEQFADVLTEAGKPVTQSSPAWYAGTTALGSAAFASSLGSSLSGAISSASVSPSSRSGGGGGGSSGGGGGGGGGGGW